MSPSGRLRAANRGPQPPRRLEIRRHRGAPLVFDSVGLGVPAARARARPKLLAHTANLQLARGHEWRETCRGAPGRVLSTPAVR